LALFVLAATSGLAPEARAASSGRAVVRDARPAVLGPGATWLIECEGPRPLGPVTVRVTDPAGRPLLAVEGRGLGDGRVVVGTEGELGRWLAGRLGAQTIGLELEGAAVDDGGQAPGGLWHWSTVGPSFSLAWRAGGLRGLAEGPWGRLTARLGIGETWRAPLAVFLAALVLLLVAAPLTGLVVVWERKVCGRMQSRLGPNRVGPEGWLQWLADGVKLIVKEDLVPTAADTWLFRLSPYLMWMSVFATLVVLPLSSSAVVADMNLGLLYLGSVAALTVVGIIMGGWASASKWSLLGGMRSAAQIVSYEIPASLSLLVVVISAGSLSLQDVVHAQGGLPHQWFVFQSPVTFAAFFVYLISALAEGNRTPFDLPEAESELVAGYNTEYSGFRYSIFYLAEWTNLYVIGAIVSAVFLGGWNIPLVAPAKLVAAGWSWQLLSAAIMVAKIVAVVFVIIWVRWSLPRFRVDQMMAFCWSRLVPASFGLVSLAALHVALAEAWPAWDLGSRLVTFGVLGLGLGALFVWRVRDNLKRVRLPHAGDRQVRSPFADPQVVRPFGLERRGGAS
jgi:NADH:ubiquinone oxidoreductase subunit H